MDPPVAVPTRFVALDLHKDYIVAGAVDAHQHVVLPVASELRLVAMSPDVSGILVAAESSLPGSTA